MQVKPRKLNDRLIKREADKLLTSVYGHKVSLPIDVDDIVQKMGIDLVYGSFDAPAILGAAIPTAIGERDIIKVNSELADDFEQEPRYRFTVSHEVGHVILHFPLLPPFNNQVNLFSGQPQEAEPIALCREIDIYGDVRTECTDYDWQEWQANVFASHLLMPEERVRKDFAACLNHIGKDRAMWQGFNAVRSRERCIQALKDRYKVSATAIEIRLKKLGLFDSIWSEVFQITIPR